MLDLVALILTLLQGLLWFNVLFYALVTVGAWLGKRHPRPKAPLREPAPLRMAVLVAAHDEEAVIGTLVSSLMDQVYPGDRREVFVVADRCSDRTSTLARSRGATVYERREGESSKGAALRWMWDQIPDRARFDGVAILDADNVADPGFLAAIDDGMRRGAQVLQGQRVAKNPEASTASALDGLAEAVHHRVVAAGLTWWGLSTTISGSGVAYASELFERLVHTTTTQVEDCEWQLQLMSWGVRIGACHEAVVYDEKIPDFEAMARQRSRWVQGKIKLFAHHIGPFMWGAMNGRRGPMEGTTYLLTMVPRSVLVVSLLACLVLGALGVPGMLSAGWWVLAIALFAAHVATGLVIEGVRASEWKSLLNAPTFIRVFLGAFGKAFGRKHIPWVRTPHGVAPAPGEVEKL